MRACSSSTTASCAKVPPPPPYSSGIDMQSRPSSPARFHSSRSTWCWSAKRFACGANSAEKNFAARSRSSSNSAFIQGEIGEDMITFRLLEFQGFDVMTFRFR
ncbi:Uncharacterised protein [Mycobacteroides abscessus subsp. abscessus]|nr:Uncharacterised protein [Mycobacteroides abscessus subsp. abscessus]